MHVGYTNLIALLHFEALIQALRDFKNMPKHRPACLAAIETELTQLQNIQRKQHALSATGKQQLLQNILAVRVLGG